MSDVLGAAPQTRSETTYDPGDVWRVQLGTGEIRAMTLDALDAAYEEGLIDESTPVLAPFAPTWSTLGVVAGIEDTQPDLTPSLSPIALSSPPPASATMTDRPVSFEVASASGELELDLPEAEELRPRRGLVIGVVATSVVGLIALPIAITTIAASSSTPIDVKATSVAAQLPPPAISPLPSAKPREEVEPKEPPALSPHQLLDEDKKKQLAEADKAREEKARKAAVEKAAAAAPATPPKRKNDKVGPALLNGGDRFDPLNGAL